MTAVDVTAVVATYNRARLLPDTLAALALQQVPGVKWEIVVVDNNSRDLTRQVVASLPKRAGVPVRYVFEPRQGLSHARNRGVQEARGAIIAFTDDDVLAPPDWMASILRAFVEWNADGVGGRILLRWEAPPPGSVTRNRFLLARLALMDCEESCQLAFPLASWPQVWGANMAFPPRDLSKGRRLRHGAGHDGRQARSRRGSRVDQPGLERGSRVVYDPRITVFHRINRHRLRRAYFLKLEFDSACAVFARAHRPYLPRRLAGSIDRRCRNFGSASATV